MTDLESRTRAFAALHEHGCFVMPNPWDVGSARMLESCPFPALATTSSGFAWSVGRADNHVTLEQALEHFSTIAAAVKVPVNGDFERGFAAAADDVYVNVTRAVATGVSGLSIEDSTGLTEDLLFAFELAVDRIRAARKAIDDSGTGVLLTARTEGFIVDRPDLPETIRRLRAFREAGADCLYAPGLRDFGDIRAVVDAVAPAPVNVLLHSNFATVSDLASLGVRRVSVGGALARVAWSGVLRAVEALMSDGTVEAFGKSIGGSKLDQLFSGL